MPVLLAPLGLVTVAFIRITRMRNAAEMTHELASVARDVAAAARRPGFRRRQDIHPVGPVDATPLAIGAIGIAFMELGGTGRSTR